MAKQIETTWGDRLREEGRLLGLVHAKRDDVLTVLRARFVPVPEELARRIEAIDTLETLDSLLLRAAAAPTLDEVRSALPD